MYARRNLYRVSPKLGGNLFCLTFRAEGTSLGRPFNGDFPAGDVKNLQP
jgi:hypothetical protein